MKNAILVAAGMGTRMRPLTEKIPKPLVTVGGKPMIETVIEALDAIQPDHIYIVVGYLGEQFQYLEKKYGNIIVLNNPDYEIYNNISSIYTAKEILKKGACYICEADLYVSNARFLEQEPEKSGYFGKYVEGRSNDWVFERSDKGYITRVGKGGNNCFNMVGISYFKEAEAKKLAEKIEEAYKKPGFEQLFWDDVVNMNLAELPLIVHPVDDEMVVEIDTIQELEEVEKRIASRGIE